MLPIKRDKSKALKASLGDYNFWPSEGDSPLVISSRNGIVPTDEDFLKLDASLRRRYAKDNATEGYKVPEDRTVARFTLTEKIWPLVLNQLEVVAGLMTDPAPSDVGREAEILEYFVQIHNEFASTQNPVVVEVRSVSELALVGFFIAGEVADDKLPDEIDTIFARTLLVQT